MTNQPNQPKAPGPGLRWLVLLAGLPAVLIAGYAVVLLAAEALGADVVVFGYYPPTQFRAEVIGRFAVLFGAAVLFAGAVWAAVAAARSLR